jgi:hypothetical protein
VGDPPQWADDSDATYGRVDNTNADVAGKIVAVLEPLPAEITVVTSVTLHVRAMLTNSGAAVGTGFSITFPDTPGVFTFVDPGGSGFGSGVIHLPGLDAIYDYETSDVETASGDPATGADLVPYLYGGATVQLFRGGFHAGVSFEYHAYVYELWLEVEGSSGGSHVPPLRLHPRSDGRGMSSAQRVWPRPPTGAYGRVGPGSLV